jgi:hypothetical protein
VTDEGRLAGHGAALYIKNQLSEQSEINVLPKAGISYVIPQKIRRDNQEDVIFKFRVQKPIKDVFVIIECGDKLLSKTFKTALIPSEMAMIKLSKEKMGDLNSDITIRLEGR